MDNANVWFITPVSYTHLTTYKSRPPVVEGLLYAGAYILAGAPKIGKSFLMAQIAYPVSYTHLEQAHQYTENGKDGSNTF